jgi:hypothetical protein
MSLFGKREKELIETLDADIERLEAEIESYKKEKPQPLRWEVPQKYIAEFWKLRAAVFETKNLQTKYEFWAFIKRIIPEFPTDIYADVHGYILKPYIEESDSKKYRYD